jgi:hypothetical protein
MRGRSDRPAVDCSRRAAMAALAGSCVVAAAPARATVPAAVDRATYEGYIAAFNARDIPGFTRFYATGATFLLGPMTMHGRQAIIDWYHLAWTRLHEHCTVRRFISDPGGVAVELETEFTAIADWPDFSAGPLREGDVLRRIGFAHYDNSPGGFTRVATALHRVVQAPAHWAKPA